MKYGRYSKALAGDVFLSIDSVIAEYKLQNEGGQRFLHFIENKLLWQYEYHEVFGGIGKYQRCFTFDFGQESTVSVLVGFYGASGRLEPDKVRIDFNPNKVDCNELRELLVWLRMNAKSSKLVRYDLAVDFPYPRRDFMLVRTDQRKRGLEELSQDNFTEYLGRRNCPGRYKLYNKTMESKLEFPLTRSELTCDGAWSPQMCLDHFPVLYRFEPFAEDGVKQYVSGSDAAVLAMMIKDPENSLYLDWFSFRKRKSLRSILAKCSADSDSVHSVVSVDDIQEIVNRACVDILS